MNELVKVDEAAYFLFQMASMKEDHRAFRCNLSAFLSAARSSLQYALDEARVKPCGQIWYDRLMNASLVLGFFKDKRDFNIHTAPIDPCKNVTIEIEETLVVHDKWTVEKYDQEGIMVERISTNDPPPAPAQQKPATVETTFTFQDWTGTEDVPTLCQRYLAELNAVIGDGMSRGFISG